VRARHLCVTHACTHTSGSVKRTDTRAYVACKLRSRTVYLLREGERSTERDRERSREAAAAYRAYIDGGGGRTEGQAGVNARA